MKTLRAAYLAFAVLTALLAGLVLVAPLQAAPKFPALTGRVVDEADVLPAETEAALTAKLETLEQKTSHQLVVVTLKSLQGYDIADFGYQLGRAWGIGRKGENDGVVFIIVPSERAVRIEVGYGLEPILTDALSSVILQTDVLPRFRNGDMVGGIVAGTDALIEQLSLDADTAKARVTAAASKAKEPKIDPMALFFIALVVYAIFSSMRRGGRGRGMANALWPIIFMGGGRGGRSGGGGGFRGGGGSFGGGGASGRW